MSDQPKLLRVKWRIDVGDNVSIMLELSRWNHEVKSTDHPFLNFMIGLEGRQVISYCEKRGWKIDLIE
jgi:hypothetical protein